jgi:oxygen-independent coproporphyrinogen III oxidase
VTTLSLEDRMPALAAPPGVAAPGLAERLAGTPYDAYVYAYPHKTAYGPLDPPRPLGEVWAEEDRSALFLYVHVPFCEMRCGFCNLFTTPKPPPELVERFVEVLERQATRVARALGTASYARFAIGGGTPTLLDPVALRRVLDVARVTIGADLARIPASVETSPETCSAVRLAILRDAGIDRISIGVQSFVEEESAAVHRPQRNVEVFGALDSIREAGFPVLNLDLIYGLPGQTLATWEQSLRTALRWRPEEVYLYPLYVRPVTSLSRRKARAAWDDERLALYRLARAFLSAEGYDQVSMRTFVRQGRSAGDGGTAYCVQNDGMVGLGPGARSYTRALHYSTEWAVGARGVREILAAWVADTDEAFDAARWGFALDADEQRRRWVLYALFVAGGLDRASYRARFGADVLDDLAMLGELLVSGAAVERAGRLELTALGIERSDTIGPWLTSESVRARMAGFAVR